MNEQTAKDIEAAFGFTLNKNQARDLERLVFEISRRENIASHAVLARIDPSQLKNHSGREKFAALKKILTSSRFPLTSAQQKIDPASLFLTKPRAALTDSWQVQPTFAPQEIIVESTVADSALAARFKHTFPNTPVTIVGYYSDYVKEHPFRLSDLKKPLVFIIKENWDFFKACPCTKEHLRCGYWILNLGFGCPFDCSYCFLQHYTNVPGLILPANLDDFFSRFAKFQANLSRPIRIGTGEFCDSLALDHVTGYAQELIEYFRDKKVVFELKTKSANIAGLLNLKPPENIVISWSLNPQGIVDGQERATASLDQRLEAAKLLQEKGWRIGFHFDPIIHSSDWEKLYAQTVNQLYAKIKPPVAWISLGTLRSNRELKTIVEQRFPESDIFYGELLLGEDKKLRYPELLRRQIYSKMLDWLREHDKKTPVYLCMENQKMWRDLIGVNDTGTIEKYLLSISFPG